MDTVTGQRHTGRHFLSVHFTEVFHVFFSQPLSAVCVQESPEIYTVLYLRYGFVSVILLHGSLIMLVCVVLVIYDAKATKMIKQTDSRVPVRE